MIVEITHWPKWLREDIVRDHPACARYGVHQSVTSHPGSSTSVVECLSDDMNVESASHRLQECLDGIPAACAGILFSSSVNVDGTRNEDFLLLTSLDAPAVDPPTVEHSDTSSREVEGPSLTLRGPDEILAEEEENESELARVKPAQEERVRAATDSASPLSLEEDKGVGTEQSDAPHAGEDRPRFQDDAPDATEDVVLEPVPVDAAPPPARPTDGTPNVAPLARPPRPPRPRRQEGTMPPRLSVDGSIEASSNIAALPRAEDDEPEWLTMSVPPVIPCPATTRILLDDECVEELDGLIVPSLLQLLAKQRTYVPSKVHNHAPIVVQNNKIRISNYFVDVSTFRDATYRATSRVPAHAQVVQMHRRGTVIQLHRRRQAEKDRR